MRGGRGRASAQVSAAGGPTSAGSTCRSDTSDRAPGASYRIDAGLPQCSGARKMDNTVQSDILDAIGGMDAEDEIAIDEA
jgi:hypothetical protein